MKENNTELQINQTAEGVVSGCTHRGLGVVRVGKSVVFVKGALPGEKITFTVTRKQKGIYYGSLKDIAEKSLRRTLPPCGFFGECGGCALQHAEYAEQLAIKTEIVKSAVKRIGGLNSENIVKPTIGMQNPFHYRNKGIFRVKKTSNGFTLGFLAEGSHNVVNGRCTLLFPESINNLTAALERELNNSRFGNLANNLSGVLVRTSFADKSLMLVLWLKSQNGNIGGKRKKTADIADVTKKSVIMLGNVLSETIPGLRVFGYAVDNGEVNPVYTSLHILSEKSHITEEISGIKFRISPESFFQVNTLQAEKMLEYTAGLLPKSKNLQIIDAYSGIGTVGLVLSHKANHVECIEIVPQAVEDAKANCHLNGLQNIRCCLGKAEELFENVSESIKEGEKTVIVDPPRKGCHTRLLAAIKKFNPSAVIYISCNPSTLARDLAILSETYEISDIQPFDMFPNSYHVETVCMLSRA